MSYIISHDFKTSAVPYFVKVVDKETFTEIYNPEFATIFSTEKEAQDWIDYSSPMRGFSKVVDYEKSVKDYQEWYKAGSPRRTLKCINRTMSRPSVVTLPKPSSAPKIESSKNTRTSSPAPVVTRERYIERYNDSGIGANPWFWMYMLDNNRPQQQIQQPAQIIVKDSDNKTVTVPENQMVIRKYSYSPVREFFVFALGGGIGVLFGRKFSL